LEARIATRETDHESPTATGQGYGPWRKQDFTTEQTKRLSRVANSATSLMAKQKTDLKAETKRRLSERKAPETNFGLSRFLLFGF
jgi:hypothetical protein